MFVADVKWIEQIVRVTERGAVLAEVERVRPSVVLIELEVLREALIDANGERIVVRTNSAENVGHGTERGVLSLRVTNRRVGWTGQHAARTKTVADWQSARR